jgi:hypothetical protein
MLNNPMAAQGANSGFDIADPLTYACSGGQVGHAVERGQVDRHRESEFVRHVCAT